MVNRLVIMEEKQIKRVIQRLSFEIMEKHGECKDFALIGIHRRGVFLAQRIKNILEENLKKQIPLGKLDINFYRDDWTSLEKQPIINKTEIPFDIEEKRLLLIDDVIFTGRTVRAAIDAILDYGRPAKVELLTLVDRGHRELPIHPDYCGKKIDTSRREYVDVLVKEIDGIDIVELRKTLSKESAF